MRAQQAEPRLERRLQRVAACVERIIALAEQREIIVREPLQELDRLRDLVDRQRRRIAAQIGNDAGNARQHRLPVLHRDAHVGEDALDVADEIGPLPGIVGAVDVDMNEALALAADSAGCLDIDQPARGITLDDENRMHEQADIEAALINLAEHGIDQKRHVVVDDLQHPAAGLAGKRLEADLGGAGRPFLQQRPGALGDAGEFGRRVALEILRHREPEQLGDEIVGDIAPALRRTTRRLRRSAQRSRSHLHGVYRLGVHLGRSWSPLFDSKRYYPVQRRHPTFATVI